jgi:flavin reductase (DIM6/NTAB) family NADH-FMN oxidoreductase RutF
VLLVVILLLAVRVARGVVVVVAGQEGDQVGRAGMAFETIFSVGFWR